MLTALLKAVIAVLRKIGHATGMVKHARRLICVSLTWAALLSPALAAAGSPTPFSPSREVVLYRGATLIDGTGSPARPDMDVLVAGERIAKVFPDSALAAPVVAKTRVVDLHGRYLMAGLIDSHVHLATP